MTNGVSARIFRMLNDLAVDAIETGVEEITDEAVERGAPSSNGRRPLHDRDRMVTQSHFR